MLKKRYSGKIIAILMTAIFAFAMAVLVIIESKMMFSRYIVTMIVLAVICILTFIALSLTLWREVEIVNQPSDYPPQGINPSQAGCVIDANVNRRDISAAFFYLAHKGYMHITEYELKKFQFEYKCWPEGEDHAMVKLFAAVFRDGKNTVPGTVVRLSDVSGRLAEVMPSVRKTIYKSISDRKNKEIADITGKVTGFKDRLLENRGDRLAELVRDNPDYLYEVFPYAYVFGISSKLSRNFEPVSVSMPDWYSPYGVSENCTFDILIYNSMLRNLPEQLNSEVYDNVRDDQLVE